jgi:hypothetical protein
LARSDAATCTFSGTLLNADVGTTVTVTAWKRRTKTQ